MLIKSKNKYAELSDEWLKHKCYGYSCDKDALKKLKRLEAYIKILKDREIALHYGYHDCLDDEAYKCLLEKLTSLVGYPKSNCKEVKVDISNRDQWDLKNPLCVSFDKWNKYSRLTAQQLEIDFEVIKNPEELVFELVQEIITPDVILALSVVNKADDLEFTISRTKEESKLDFELLLEKVETDLTLEAYLDLVDHNISFDIIKIIYESNLSLSIENEKVYLKTPLSSYPIKDLGLDLSLIKTHLKSEPSIKEPDLLTDYC
jgi:hypothetical protein